MSKDKKQKWVKLTLKPKTYLCEIASEDSTHYYTDVYLEDGYENQEFKKSDVDKIVALKAPEIITVDDRQVKIFEDGSILINDALMDQNQALTLFKKLGNALGYDIAG